MSEDTPVKDIQTLGNATVITLSGDVDIVTSPMVRQSVMTAVAANPEILAVELTEVDFMDSSGVATLVEAFQRLKRNGRRLVLVGMQPKVKSVFEITKLTSLFEIKATLAEVVADE